MLYSDMLIQFTFHAKLLTTKGTGQPCCIHLETQRWSEKDAECVMTSHIPCDVITCVMMSSQTAILDLVIWGWPSWIWPYGGSHLVGGHHGSGHMGRPSWICSYGGSHFGSAHMGGAVLDLPIWWWPFWISPYGGSHFGSAHMGAAILDLLIWGQPLWMGIPVAREIPVARHVTLLRTSPLLGNHVMGYPRPLLRESLPPHAWVSEWVSEWVQGWKTPTILLQKTLVKVPIVLGGNWPWPWRSNLT